MSNLNQANLSALKENLRDYRSHLLTILDGAVVSFGHTSNPLRFTNSANGLRELLRELFESAAPDSEIKRCSWFTPDRDAKNGVTRRHRISFTVCTYLDPNHFPSNFVSEIDKLADAVRDQVGILSKLTHVTAATLTTTELKAVAVFDSTTALFLRLFEAIDSGREHLLDALQTELQQALDTIFTSDFFDELDILSTHTRPQEVEDVEVEIDEIDEETITFSGTGSVLCDLQYGSDGDCDRGDGFESSDAYPFTFSGRAQTVNPRIVTVKREDIAIDTAKFYA